MRIYDVPKGFDGVGRQLRVGVHGSCRVYDPFEALVADGKLIKAWGVDTFVSYTLGEARQAFRHCLGKVEIPSRLLPFIVDQPHAVGPWGRSFRRMPSDLDAFIIEVSELRELSYRDFYFQIQVFFRNFITTFGSALAPWFASLLAGRHFSEEQIQEALAGLVDVSGVEHSHIESVLRETRLTAIDTAETAGAFDQLRFSPTVQWLLVSHFAVPGLSGTLMDDRKTLAKILRQVTEICGIGFFDPTELVTSYGREVVLADAGRDIYHYDPHFHARVAEVLLQRVQAIDPSASRPFGSRCRAEFPIGRQAVETQSSKLNVSLVSLHRRRVQRLGIDGSGLHSHYECLLERGEILGKQETDLVDMILNYLPEFEGYHVLCAGLGEVAFLLAALGKRATACDPFVSRFSAITAGADHLVAAGLHDRDRLSAARMAVPSVRRRNRLLCVATRLSITVSSAEERRIMRRLYAYQALLFRPSLLVRSRGSAAEQEELLGRFRAAGFAVVREYPQRDLVYCGRAFDDPAALQSGGRLGELARALVGRS